MGLLVYRLRIKFDTNYLLLFTYRILYRYFFALHISTDIPINLSINYKSINIYHVVTDRLAERCWSSKGCGSFGRTDNVINDTKLIP